VRDLGDGSAGVHALRGDDPEVTGRHVAGVARRPRPSDHLTGAAQPQAPVVDRLHVLVPHVDCPDLDVVELREVGREQ
jgi:hypothetical protein